MASRSIVEQEARAQTRAHTFLFGCGNGGIIFDESMDPTEMVSIQSQDERDEAKLGHHQCPFEALISKEEQQEQGIFEGDEHETPVAIKKPRKPLNKEQKKAKRARYQANKKARESR